MEEIVSSKIWFLLVAFFIMPGSGVLLANNDVGLAILVWALQIPYLISIAFGWSKLR